MSTIRADNYSKRDGSSIISADTLLQGTDKAWLNFNGTGVIAIRDNFNISSVTDLSVGAYQPFFSVARPNANYAIKGSTMPLTGSFVISDQFTVQSAPLVNSVVVSTGFYSTAGVQTARDADGVYIGFAGDP